VPGAVLRLFGLPASALTEPLVALDDVMGPRARTWHKKIAAAASASPESVGVAVAGLLRDCLAASGADPAKPGLEVAVRALRRGTRVGEVVATARLSTSTRHINAATGLLPKQHGRLGRLRRVIEGLDDETQGVPANFSDLAQATGFTDLAHLSREFKSLTGMTLTAYARSGAQGGVPRATPAGR